MEPTPNEPRRGFHPNWIYLSIIAVLLAAAIYLFLSKNKTENQNEELSNQITTVSNDKASIETEYNAALARLDQMRGESARMDSLLNTKDEEISAMKSKIEAILKQKNLTKSQLKEANMLIAELKARMTGFEQQLIALKQENIELSEDNRQLTEDKNTLNKENENLQEEKNNLEKKVEIGSVLHASNIQLEAIQNKKNLFGKEKEKETGKARKADFIRISFDLDDNRISESGEKTLYICVYDPAGNLVQANSSSRFRIADKSEKGYSLSKIVPYKQGEKVQDISADWRPPSAFEPGNYKVEIYHMGYRIGSEKVSLK
ncbi:MAG TPA: hypothetical protein PLP34_02295 [Chitinophagaceae bacterium]|nr:hypothetical protein [Chitinophagaceae bacterium]HNF71212.1 hypothetical protein [Chitinophagaceae bacterium]